MALSPSIFLGFIVLVTVIALATSDGGHGPAGVVNEQHSVTNDAHGERSFGFPFPGIIFREGNKVNTESEATAEHKNENNNDDHNGGRFGISGAAGIVRSGSTANSEVDATEHQIGPNVHSDSDHHHNDQSERKFRWPSSVGITISRSHEQNSESGSGPDHHIGQNGPNHEHHHHHNHSAHNNDTQDGERKFRWPSSVGITISRSHEQNSESGGGPDHHIGQNGPSHGHHHHHNHSAHNNGTEDERKFRWPSSVGITVSRSHEQNSESGANHHVGQNGPSHEHHHHHNHSAHNNDTQDGERKFRWPGSVGITITRSSDQNSESGANHHVGQNGPNHEHHHHHNHSAHNNDTQDGERKFRWPSSVGITISRSNEQHSETEHEDNEAKLFGLLPSFVSCNHTEQAGRSCTDCTHTLLCLANDVGIQRNCSPLYCNQGRCSSEPSVDCAPAT